MWDNTERDNIPKMAVTELARLQKTSTPFPIHTHTQLLNIRRNVTQITISAIDEGHRVDKLEEE